MFTISYKGWFIHGRFDQDEVRVQSPTTYEIHRAGSMRSARRLIRKLIG